MKYSVRRVDLQFSIQNSILFDFLFYFFFIFNLMFLFEHLDVMFWNMYESMLTDPCFFF